MTIRSRNMARTIGKLVGKAAESGALGLLPPNDELNTNIVCFWLRPLMVDFLMPESDKDRGENPIVDSLAVASDWTIVSKCALHGLIYVFDLKVSTTVRGGLSDYGPLCPMLYP